MKFITKIFGVPVHVHWTFVLLATALFLTEGLATLLILTFSIFAHEMGHALAAIRYSDMKPNIAFMGFGGVMFGEGTELPTPLKEAAISAAGPFFNFGLALLALPFYSVTSYFVIVNVAIGIFNLAPCYPLDGGHILKSLLRLKYDTVLATKIAFVLGLGVCLAISSIFFLAGSFFIPAIFLLFFPYMGWKEYKQTKDFYDNW